MCYQIGSNLKWTYSISKSNFAENLNACQPFFLESSGTLVVDSGVNYYVYPDLSCAEIGIGDNAQSAVYDKNSPPKTLNLKTSIEFNGVSYPVKTVKGHAFYKLKGVTSLTLPQNLEIIESFGFDMMDMTIETVVLPTSLKYIGMHAFATSLISNFVIGSNVETIIHGAFCNNPVKKIIVSDDNNFFVHDKQYSLYNKEKTILIAVTSFVKDFVVPNTVKMIWLKAFELNTLNSIVIPKNVTFENDVIFSYCYELKTITFYGNISQISSGSFIRLCPNLQTIYYFGNSQIPNRIIQNPNAFLKIVVSDSSIEYFSNIKTTMFHEYKKKEITCKSIYYNFNLLSISVCIIM